MFLAFVTALMPLFSALPAQADVMSGDNFVGLSPQRDNPERDNVYIVKFIGADHTVFKDDPAIISVDKVFINTPDPEFQKVFRVKARYELSAFKSAYRGRLEYIHTEQRLQAGAVSVTDPGFTSDPTNTDKQWGLPHAKFLEAWEQTTGNSNTVIAIIDTGVDGTHEDLSAGQVSAGFNFVANAHIPLSANSDDNGHGTLMAGIIGATPNNFKGVAGTNWNVTIMPLKALDASGAGNSGDVSAAIVWAADHGAHIINLSLGGFGFANDTTLSNAVSYAFNKNVVLIAAAGNDVAATGGNLDLSPIFPICHDNNQNMIIGVVAVDVNDQKAQFSNFGRACVDVSAPGRRILSTINRDPRSRRSLPNGYVFGSGTSLAAPFVAGEAALIKSLYPNATNREIRDRIIKSADQIDNLNPTQCMGQSCAGMIGSGRINAHAALQRDLLPTLEEGSLVQAEGTSVIYYVSGGKKLPVSQFVLNQRFAGITPRTVPAYMIEPLPVGPSALPSEGALVKPFGNPTVYAIIGGFRRPVTYQVFLQRNLGAQPIFESSGEEIDSWISSTFLPPTEGTLVKAPPNPTVYWVVDGLLHPINYEFWVHRGLNIFPIMTVPSTDISGYAIGNPFIR